MSKRYFLAAALAILCACRNATHQANESSILEPAIVTDTVIFDADDPAIWINTTDLAKSLIVGTDKETGGGLYAFDLRGKIAAKVTGLERPNNVDIVSQVPFLNSPIDIAITTERGSNRLRAYSLPLLEEVKSDSMKVFEGEAERQPMGIAIYTRPADHKIFVIVGRKSGPADGYLWQYELMDRNGMLHLELVRKFGRYSGVKEIESIAVDNEMGYVYYSDEQVGIRKYYADPSRGNDELAMFGQKQYKEDNEGISIYKVTDSTGYILVSDQSANRFNIYPREGKEGQPHLHELIDSIAVSTIQSDGSEVTSVSLPGFPGGLFVAMSDDKTYQYYRWSDIAKRAKLKISNVKK